MESIRTIMTVHHGHTVNPLGSHLALIAGIEAAAAVLFLVPRTLKAGGILLLIIFFLAIVVHGLLQELGLLVYAAGVLFVIIHGSVFSKELLYTRRAPPL